MRIYSKLAAILAAVIMVMAANSCGGRNHGNVDDAKLDQARNDARYWASELVKISRQDTAALQQCILEAKAAQSRYLVEDENTAEEMTATFDEAYSEYLDENAPELARELF